MIAMVRTTVALFLLVLTAEVRSETVDVKYRGPVDLKTFECRDTPRSSFIQRVCYDKPQSYMIINLKGTYYHYCDLPSVTFRYEIAADNGRACRRDKPGAPCGGEDESSSPKTGQFSNTAIRQDRTAQRTSLPWHDVSSS